MSLNADSWLQCRSPISYDISVEKLPTTEECHLSDDFEPPTLGAAADVRALLAKAGPSITFVDQESTSIAGSDWSMEIFVHDDPVAALTLAVGGEVASALPTAFSIARTLDPGLISMHSGEPMPPQDDFEAHGL